MGQIGAGVLEIDHKVEKEVIVNITAKHAVVKLALKPKQM